MKRNNIINYAILSSHRSGSSLLCNLLSHTNVAGKPNEFFGEWDGSMYKKYDMLDYEAYLNRIIAEFTTQNGVFGAKTMSNDILNIFKHLETFPEFSDYTYAEKVRIFFPNIKFIYLTRRNKVEQAISWWKATQNHHYHTTDFAKMPATPLEYNFNAISHLINEINMEECAHQEVLSLLESIPLTLVYEDYIQDMRGTVQKIMEFLEIEDAYTFREPTLYQMADVVTQEWAERYRQELQDGWINLRW